MENRHAADEARIFQVRIEIVDLLREEHAFVDNILRRQRAHIKFVQPLQSRPFFNAAANDIKNAIKLFLTAPFGIAKQDLLNIRPGQVCLCSEHPRLHRHLPPPVDIKSAVENFRFDNRPRRILRAKIRTRQKQHADADVLIARLVTGALDKGAE